MTTCDLLSELGDVATQELRSSGSGRATEPRSTRLPRSRPTSASVVLAVRDGMPELTEQLEALAAQVVDASARPGQQYGRRSGARGSQGELLAFCDHDDVVAPGPGGRIGTPRPAQKVLANDTCHGVVASFC